MSTLKSFAATNEPHTCLWCGAKLREEMQHTERPATPEEIAAAQASRDRAQVKHEAEVNRADRDIYGVQRRWRGRQDIARRADGMWMRTIGSGTGRYGWEGNGFFCTLRCGEAFGIAFARAGKRLKAETND